MVRLRRIPAIRAANLLSLTVTIPYLILTLVFFVFLFPVPAGQNTTIGTLIGPLIGLLVGWPVAMLWIWVLVAFICGLYNLIAGRLGGIELEFTTIPPRD